MSPTLKIWCPYAPEPFILVELRCITASGKGIAPKNRINQGISQMIYSSEGISQKIA